MLQKPNRNIKVPSDNVVITYHNGDVYEGQIHNGKRHGFGTIKSEDGKTYSGLFQNGIYLGYFTKRIGWKIEEIKSIDDTNDSEIQIKYIDGSKYIGRCYHGKRHGYGEYWLSDGTHLKGFFSKNEYVGKFEAFDYQGNQIDSDSIPYNYSGIVKISFINDDTYYGNWKDGTISGFGTYTYSNGNQYQGSWINWKKEGRDCTFSFSDGSVYTGSFHDDLFSGYGVLKFSNGTTYMGLFKKGLFFGKGTIIFPIDRCEFTWKNNIKNGPFVYVSKEGAKIEGNFDDGILIGELKFTSSKKHTIKVNYNKGKFTFDEKLLNQNKQQFLSIENERETNIDFKLIGDTFFELWTILSRGYLASLPQEEYQAILDKSHHFKCNKKRQMISHVNSNSSFENDWSSLLGRKNPTYFLTGKNFEEN